MARGASSRSPCGIEHVDLIRIQVQRDRRAEREDVHACELRDHFTDRRLDVHEGIGAGDLGQLDLAGQRDVTRALRTRSAPARMPTVSAALPGAGNGTARLMPAANVTPCAAAVPAIRFIGGSLNARATRIDFGRWNTSVVGPYCSNSPASITAV